MHSSRISALLLTQHIARRCCKSSRDALPCPLYCRRLRARVARSHLPVTRETRVSQGCTELRIVSSPAPLLPLLSAALTAPTALLWLFCPGSPPPWLLALATALATAIPPWLPPYRPGYHPCYNPCCRSDDHPAASFPATLATALAAASAVCSPAAHAPTLLASQTSSRR